MDTPLFCPSVAIGSARWTRVQNRTISQAQWKCSAERAPGPEAFTRRNALQQAALAALAIGASAVGVPDSANALSKKRLLAKAGPEVVTEEGLVYRDITVGKGNSPRFGDSVAVHYSLFYDDFEVESSRESQGLAASPIGFTFGAESGPGAVMKGMNLGIDGMKVGGMRFISVPAKYAFGARGRPPMIPPNADVEIAVSLLSCKRAGTNPISTLDNRSQVY